MTKSSTIRSIPEINSIQIARMQFPFLNSRNESDKCVYLDSAATTQKPQCVIDAESNYYKNSNANIHRAVYQLSERSTDLYESARRTVAAFVGASGPDEIVFTSGTTDSLNKLAWMIAPAFLYEGDEVIITELEHHASLLPWQKACRDNKLVLKVWECDDDGILHVEALESIISSKTKVVVFTHVSNTLGVELPVEEIVRIAKSVNALTVLDCAQSIQHMALNLTELDVDFAGFSGHKMYGPMGTGVLYGKRRHLLRLDPFVLGGGIVERVTMTTATFSSPPQCFEPGTPNVAGVVALAEACRFLDQIGIENVALHEADLLQYCESQLSSIFGLRVLAKGKSKHGSLSFVFDDIHPHDVGTILSAHNVAVRTGHHCTQPLMNRLGVPATTRVSVGVYNTREDIDILILALNDVTRILR